MRSRRAVLLALLFSLTAYVLAVSIVYEVSIREFEGKPRGFLDSLQWAANTITNTGYGRDTYWSHPFMIFLVIFVQFSGMVLVPLAVGLFILPYLAERFEQRLPRLAHGKLANHVLVYRYGPAVETLLTRLRDRGIPTLVAETDEKQARSVLERGQAVVFSRSDEDVLDVCRLGAARAMVANGADEENAGVILRARQMGFRGEIYAFVENPSHRKPIELAGATSAYTPRHIIAAAMAAHASDQLSPRLPGLAGVAGVERREIRVPPSAPLAGTTLAESRLGGTTGVIVVGKWLASRLETRCTAEMVIEGGSVLELVGTAGAIQAAAEAIGGPLLRNTGPFIIAGFGEVGRKVHELLADAGDEVRVIERRAAPDVDVVGDVLDFGVLAAAGVAGSRGVILALDSDDATLFATVIARDAVPDVPIIARVNHSRNLANIHRAGADFALSISDISGEMLTARLLGRTARARDEQRRIVRLPASRWTGMPIAQLPLRNHGCSAIALERSAHVIALSRDLTVESGDALWICGTAERVNRVE